MFLDGYLPQIIDGCKMTIMVSVTSIFIGVILGVIGALGEMNNLKIIRKISQVINSIVRGLPELLILFVIYFIGTILLSKIFGKYTEINIFLTGVIALSIIFGAYAAQTFRGAFLHIHKGQRESAMALGLSRWVTFKKILFPQALRYALPSLSNLCLTTLKDSSLISLIGLHELTFKSQLAATQSYKPFIFYLVCGLIYLILTSLFELVFKLIEFRVSYD